MTKLVFIQTRSWSAQNRYLFAARGESNSKLLDWRPYFIHCDNQNVGQSPLLVILRTVPGMRRLPRLILTFQIFHSIMLGLRGEDSTVYFRGYKFDLDAMRSHLAKRLQMADMIACSRYRLSIWVLIYDQLTMNLLLRSLVSQFPDGSPVIFNGRVSPEALVKSYFPETTYFVEQGFSDPSYFSPIKPVSKQRWDNEMLELFGSIPPRAKAVPKPQTAIFFATSPYEYCFADKDFSSQNNELESQFAMVVAFVKVASRLGISVKVKFHPRTPRKRFLEDYGQSQFPIEFTEVVDDALDLIKSTDLVVVSSSSLAIDGALFDRPVAHLSPAFYEKGYVSHPIYTEANLERFMRNPFKYEHSRQRAKILKSAMLRSAESLDEKVPVATRVFRLLKRLALGH